MRQTERRTARPDITQRLLIVLLAFIAFGTAHAQVAALDFQVIHLSQHPPTLEKYTAVRTQGAWDAMWSAGSKDPNSPPIPTIDFKHFILLIANSGPKPSSGYSTVFTSVREYPEYMRGSASAQKMVTSIQILEISSGNCPVMTQLTNSIAYALIPQTTNEISFSISRADSNCETRVNPPFIK
jgi:hypothetical protein